MRNQKPAEKLAQNHAPEKCMSLRQLLDGLKRLNRVTHSAEGRPRPDKGQAQLACYLIINNTQKESMLVLSNFQIMHTRARVVGEVCRDGDLG
jgi:hypothetical protein